MIVDDAVPKSYSKEDIIKASLEDEILMKVREAVHKGIWPKELKKHPYYNIRKELSVRDNILLKGR